MSGRVRRRAGASACRASSAALAMPINWIEQRLSELAAVSIAQLVQAENQQQAADQVSIRQQHRQPAPARRNTDWHAFVETMSAVGPRSCARTRPASYAADGFQPPATSIATRWRQSRKRSGAIAEDRRGAVPAAACWRNSMRSRATLEGESDGDHDDLRRARRARRPITKVGRWRASGDDRKAVTGAEAAADSASHALSAAACLIDLPAS